MNHTKLYRHGLQIRASVGLLIAFLLFSCNSTNNVISKYNTIKDQINNWSLDLGEYFLDGVNYYDSINQFYERHGDDQEYIKFIEKRIIDPFASENQFLKYVPIYSHSASKPVACLFLSVGEDGYFNNDFTQKLYIDNWHTKINAYNIDEVVTEMQKFKLRYPVINGTNGRQGWYIFHVDESALANESLKLKGDSLFKDTFDRSAINSISNHRKPFAYPEFSKQRQLNGTKDYIVNWGCRVIEYKIVKNSFN